MDARTSQTATSSRWHDLQVFLATARGGSLASAAKTLGVNASTVHRRLAALERTLGARLFDRSSHGYRLTSAGNELLEHARSIEAEVLRAERRLRGRDQSVSGPIRVSTVDDLSFYVLSPLLSQFCVRHPRVRLELSIDSDDADLARRQADVAIRPGASPRDSDVIARRVCGISVALYASREYLVRHGRLESIDAIGAHPLVRGDAGRANLAMERAVNAHSDPEQAALRSNSMLARLAAIRDGLGVGMLPCVVADAEPSLVRIGPAHAEAAASLWILIHPDMRRSARVRTFVDFMLEALEPLRGRFEVG
ncbi:MAG TPA: LysR family transcriptional regulator [Burkholderiaceae bacterium]|nr:LysR family transcriptional regulator [Burkholderiaceae bacterium]